MSAYPGDLGFSDEYAQIRLGYENMWQEGRPALLRGETQADPVPSVETKRWGVSLIYRVLDDLKPVLHKVIGELKAFTGSSHTFYDSSPLHCTVRTLEPFRPDVADDDAKVFRYIEAITKAVQGVSAFDVVHQGLSANPTGIIARGYPIQNTLQDFRKRLHRQFEAAQLLAEPEDNGPRIAAHSSLVVFGGAIEQPLELVNYIDQNQETFFGTAHIRQLELVRYNRSQFAVETIPLARFSLD